MTARWVVDEVQPHRDLNITWQSISLLEKNQPAEDSDYYAPVLFTHKLLRVIEAIRKGEGEARVKDAYWEFATRIHHDKNRQDSFDLADALATAFNVIGYPDAIKYANNNNIALMLVVDIDGGAELIFSNKWYDLNL